LTPRRIHFIVNPHSANGTTGKEWCRIRAKARDRLGRFEARLTTGPGHATHLAREAVVKGADIIICVGGDGTLNEVMNGLIDEEGGTDSKLLLGLLPRGTGCDFAKSFPVPRDVDRNLDSVIQSKTRTIDVGRLAFRDHHGRASQRYFHNVVSFGLGGEVDERVNRTTKAFGGFASFLWATLASILLYKKKKIHISVDGRFYKEVTTWNVAVANGEYHGGGMRVAPGAVLDDGLFQMTVIGDLTLASVFLNLPRLYNGTIYGHKKITKLTGRSIEASSFQEVLIDMDGEQPGRLPATVDIVPSALRMICD
jgi:YegS/Rv2252/BmrU family lipid kinase